MNDENALLVQSDRTILLDLYSPHAEEARRDIVPFAELVKSPEHVHTYMISDLSLWNAISAGLSTEEITRRLEKWSKYEIDQRVMMYIDDIGRRYGEFVLTEDPDDKAYLILTVKRKLFQLQIKTRFVDRMKFLEPVDNEGVFRLLRARRGEFKILMINLGFPVVDMVPMRQGAEMKFNLKPELDARYYQKEAVESLYGNGEPGTGFGTIVLPCGAGKTIVGILAMHKIQKQTVIIVPNISAIHQWIREIARWTDIPRDQIGEYSGERKEIKPVTVTTYQSMIGIKDKKTGETVFELFDDRPWGFIVYDEVHMLPAPSFQLAARLQSIYRLGLTATLVREDGKQGEVFTLVGPKRYDTPWINLAEKGFIAKAYCHEIRLPMNEDDELEYGIAENAAAYKIAALNRNKLKVIRTLLKRHEGEQMIIIGQYLDQLKEIQKEFGFPIITGSTSNKKRDELYDKFRTREITTLIVSKVANFAIDLPDASVAIQVSGTYGSRQEEAQRLGRILRPKEKDCHFYTLVTEFTKEEEFALKRQRFLAEQGYSYTLERTEC